VADFHARYPAVEIDFQVATSGGALELVRTHRVELAVAGGMTVPPELDSEPLLEYEVVLVGPPRLAGRRLRAKELEGETWISREEGSATRAAVEAARWQVGLRAVRSLELPSREAVTQPGGRRGAACRSRRAPLAARPHDLARHRARGAAHAARRALPRAAPGRVPAGRRAAPELEPPRPSTAIVGHEREVGDLLELLRREDVRLVTLTGAGAAARPGSRSRRPPRSWTRLRTASTSSP
jgi:hypothetical protein